MNMNTKKEKKILKIEYKIASLIIKPIQEMELCESNYLKIFYKITPVELRNLAHEFNV